MLAKSAALLCVIDERVMLHTSFVYSPRPSNLSFRLSSINNQHIVNLYRPTVPTCYKPLYRPVLASQLSGLLYAAVAIWPSPSSSFSRVANQAISPSRSQPALILSSYSPRRLTATLFSTTLRSPARCSPPNPPLHGGILKYHRGTSVPAR